MVSAVGIPPPEGGGGCQKNPDYLTKLERGEISDPRYSLGEGLIELYKLHVDTSIPMIGGGKQERLF